MYPIFHLSIVPLLLLLLLDTQGISGNKNYNGLKQKPDLDRGGGDVYTGYIARRGFKVITGLRNTMIDLVCGSF